MILQLPKNVAVLSFYIFLLFSSSLIFPSSVEGAAVHSVRLEPIYKNTGKNLFSVFSIVNTSLVTADYAVEFFWSNDEYVSGDNFQLQPGGGCTDPCTNICQPGLTYDMSSTPFSEDPFTGYVVISSDQPFEACIAEPECSFFVIPNQNGGGPVICL